MPKRKRDYPLPKPTRSSTRPRQPRKISPSQGTCVSQPSLADTEIEKNPEDWNNVKSRALERLSSYEVANDSDKLQDCFRALLDWLPPGGRDSMAHDILNADSDKTLLETYQNILTCLLRPVRATAGKTPVLIESPYEKRRANVRTVYETIDEPQKRIARFREDCLERDEGKCVVTKFITVDEAEATGSQAMCTDLEAAHIIPFSFANYDASTGPDIVSKMWEVLYRLFPDLVAIIQSNMINHIENGLTLHHSIHRAFGRFRCAFEPIDNAPPHTYNFVTFKFFPQELAPYSADTITFVDASQPDESRLPHPALLDCHYRLAKFFNASGMAEVIDKNLKDLEELKERSGLATDGTTNLGSLLEYALWESVRA